MFMNIRWEFLTWFLVSGFLFYITETPGEGYMRDIAFLLFFGIFFTLKAIEQHGNNIYGGNEITRVADNLEKLTKAVKGFKNG